MDGFFRETPNRDDRPFKATGGSTRLTLEPSESLASATGTDSLTIRLQRPAIAEPYLQFFLRGDLLFPAEQAAIPFQKDAFCPVDHDLRDRIIIDEFLKNIQFPDAVEKFGPERLFSPETYIAVPCLFQNQIVNLPVNLLVFHLPCLIQPFPEFFSQVQSFLFPFVHPVPP